MPEVILDCNPGFSSERSTGIKSVLKFVNSAEVKRSRSDFVNKPELIANAENRRNYALSRVSRGSRTSEIRAERIKSRGDRDVDTLNRYYKDAQGSLMEAWRSVWARVVEHKLEGEELVYVDGLGPTASTNAVGLDVLNGKRATTRLDRYKLMTPGVRILLYHASGGEVWNPDDNPRRLVVSLGGTLAAQPTVHLSPDIPHLTPLVDVDFEGQRPFSTSLHQKVAIGDEEIGRFIDMWTAEHQGAFDGSRPLAGAELKAANVFIRVGAELGDEALAS